MFNKIILTCMLALPFVLTADDHKMHDKTKKEMMEKKRMEMMMQRKQRMGFWKPEDCKKVSDASGLFLYFSSISLTKTGAANKLSVGISKKPWIWPACRSTVTTL